MDVEEQNIKVKLHQVQRKIFVGTQTDHLSDARATGC
jgi:hypothetical protein